MLKTPHQSPHSPPPNPPPPPPPLPTPPRRRPDQRRDDPGRSQLVQDAVGPMGSGRDLPGTTSPRQATPPRDDRVTNGWTSAAVDQQI